MFEWNGASAYWGHDVKKRFWQAHAQDGLLAAQIKVLNRLLDAGPEDFEGKLNARKYMSIAGAAKTKTKQKQQDIYKSCRKVMYR